MITDKDPFWTNPVNKLQQPTKQFKGMEHVPNIFMSFDKYLFLEVINILI